jgi:hypothetical protein
MRTVAVPPPDLDILRVTPEPAPSGEVAARALAGAYARHAAACWRGDPGARAFSAWLEAFRDPDLPPPPARPPDALSCLLGELNPALGFALWHYAPQRVVPNPRPGGATSLGAVADMVGLLWGQVVWWSGTHRWTALSHALFDFAGPGARVYLDQRFAPPDGASRATVAARRGVAVPGRPGSAGRGGGAGGAPRQR